MRGLLRFLVFLAVALTIATLLVVQLILPAIVTAEVRAAIPVSATPVAVDVRTSLDGVLLHGRIDAVTMSASNVRRGLVTAAALQITVTDIGILDRSVGTLTGTLSGVELDQGIRPPVRLSQVRLSGNGAGMQVQGQITAAELEIELESALLRDASDPVLAAAHVSVSDGVIHVKAGSTDVTATVRLVDGAIVLDGGSLGTLTIVAPPPDGSWQVTGIQLGANGAIISATAPMASSPPAQGPEASD